MIIIVTTGDWLTIYNRSSFSYEPKQRLPTYYAAAHDDVPQ